MKNILTVSIGIPAYNEEKNIRGLINQILTQERKRWELKEILIFSDGSSDDTVREVKKITNKKIKIYADSARKGKSFRVSQIFYQAKGDVIILFDADVTLSNSKVIEEILRVFIHNQKVMLAGANARPFLPKTFFEKSLYTSLSVYFDSREYLNNGNNIFSCTGACFAIKKSFAKTIKMGNIIEEDNYLYLLCKSKGYEYSYAKNAIVYYKLPNNLRDYIHQTFRSTPESAKIEHGKVFGKLLDQEFKRPLLFYINSALNSFLSNPIGFIYIAAVKLMCKPFYPFVRNNHKLSLFSIKSTKA
jgi:glycosyltransferase involved in cell wall biosynthesis